MTKRNDDWLKSLVDKEEYASKSEVVNDLIRKARSKQEEIDWLRLKLERAEHGGYTELGKEEILEQARANLKQ